jgi:hypothetical protein
MEVLDDLWFDGIAENAELGSSYWISLREAALRDEWLTVAAHCSLIASDTREAFAIGESNAADKARCAA